MNVAASPSPPPLSVHGQDAGGPPCTQKVGRYSAEERREKIERYRTKRNQRNFHKKITVMVSGITQSAEMQSQYVCPSNAYVAPIRASLHCSMPAGRRWRTAGPGCRAASRGTPRQRPRRLQATRGRPPQTTAATSTATTATSPPPTATTSSAGKVAKPRHWTTASGGGKRRWPLQLRSGILRAAQRWTDADRVPVPQTTVHAEAVAWRRRLPLVPAGRLSFCCWLGRRHQRIGSKTAGETPAQQPSGLARACGRGLVGVGLVDLETRGGPDVLRRIAK